jgi:hypothetical protein
VRIFRDRALSEIGLVCEHERASAQDAVQMIVDRFLKPSFTRGPLDIDVDRGDDFRFAFLV